MGRTGHRVSLRLLDPTSLSATDWPPGAEALQAYATAFAQLGSTCLIANVRTRVLVLLDGNVVVPVTVNDAEYDNSYVCSPYNAYVVYARDELYLLPHPALRIALGGVLDAAGAALRRARINRSVVVNNWMLSTNLYPLQWKPDVPALTATLTRAYPDHAIIFRSLNRWTNAALLDRLVGAGYKLVASRQVYAYDRLNATWLPRSNVVHDRRLLRQSAYRVVQHEDIAESDYGRIAGLYEALYRQKYPIHNPAFTAEYMRLCHRRAVMRFAGLRAADGRLDGVVGLFGVGDILTAPIVGYDTSLDRRLGLYRLLMLLPFLAALACGAAINLSAGAAAFKRLRGGRPVLEYSAIFDRHLARPRRAAISALGLLSNHVAAPLMERLEL
jgi:hypothetical protein